MIESIKDAYAFERQVCSILYQTSPSHLSHYDGGPDRGRDICVQYEDHEKKYNIIVECKYYSSGVNKESIMPSLNWATVHQPELLYLWVVPYLTPSAKDFINEFAQKYKIAIAYEEQINIEHYMKYIDNDNADVWFVLRKKILSSCSRLYNQELFVPEYEFKSTDDGPFLVDRENERRQLLYKSQRIFYLQGISSCGKTQLLKYVAFVYLNRGKPIFWHTIRSTSVNQQCCDFFNSFAHYFDSVHHNSDMVNFFNTYGFYMSQDLENVIMETLKKFSPVIFIDDVHNCLHDNIPMRTLFELLIKYQLCRVYFSGWYNIFELSPNEKRNIQTIFLEGMKKRELDRIIEHSSGKPNPGIAELIETQYGGLPGYAVIADPETSIEDIEGDDGFLVRFLALLTYEEKVVLFALSFLSHEDIPKDFLFRNGYSQQVISLKSKNLIIERKCCYTIHDRYGSFFSHQIIEKALQCDIEVLIEEFAQTKPSAYLVLISFQLLNCRSDVAWETLSKNFYKLLHCQLYSEVMALLQKIEEQAKGRINSNKIIVKKIILLERLGEYSLCLKYLLLLDDANLFEESEQEVLLYIHIRCLYFLNQYDEIIEIYNKRVQEIESFQNRNISVQILLTVGRAYYIRGALSGALAYYLLAYQNANDAQEHVLEIKAIHRIAMIERHLGQLEASRKTFQELARLDSFITSKRRSYIYYRIAKCYFDEGNLIQAKTYNEKSIRIKTSFNDIRGLTFSDNLNARISLQEGDFLSAYCESSKACCRAEQLGLNKEWLAAALIRIKANMAIGTEGISVEKELKRCLEIASSEKLLPRLQLIEKMSKECFPDIYMKAQQTRQQIQQELAIAEEEAISGHITKLDGSLQSRFKKLAQNNIPISEYLLLRTGLYSPLAITTI